MIKVIIFDGINCVSHQEPLSVGLAKDYDIPLEKTLPFFKGVLQDCVAGRADLKEVLPPYLDAWGWGKGVDALLDYWFGRDHKIDQQLVSYINSLRKNGIVCVLGTNNEKYRVAYMLDKMGFANMFDKTYSSAQIGHKKPDYRFFQKIFDDLENIDKKEILFLDDKLENVKGAEDFGIHAELYTSFEDFEKIMKQYLAK
jgi:putative hydrolase of the HAD superfamily